MIETPRLLLRPPRPGDERAAFDGWMHDAQTLRYLTWTPHRELAQTKALLDWAQARWLKHSGCTWMLVPWGQSEPVGMVELVPQQRDPPQFHWRLGYVLARPRWGGGLMREAVAAVVEEAFGQPDMARVDAVCDIDNTASMRLLAALGFTLEGVLRAHALHPNAGPHPRDVRLYARVR